MSADDLLASPLVAWCSDAHCSIAYRGGWVLRWTLGWTKNKIIQSEYELSGVNGLPNLKYELISHILLRYRIRIAYAKVCRANNSSVYCFQCSSRHREILSKASLFIQTSASLIAIMTFSVEQRNNEISNWTTKEVVTNTYDALVCLILNRWRDGGAGLVLVALVSSASTLRWAF